MCARNLETRTTVPWRAKVVPQRSGATMGDHATQIHPTHATSSTPGCTQQLLSVRMAKHGKRLERRHKSHDLNIIESYQSSNGNPLGVGKRNQRKPLHKYHWFLIKTSASVRTGGRLVVSSIPASFETSPQAWNESEHSMPIYQRPNWAIHLLATHRQAVQPDLVGQVLRPHMFKNPVQCQISLLAIMLH